MNESPLEVEVAGGVLHGHYGGTGIPALLLHGGPGLSDYMAGCAAELGRLFTTVRYTQRGVEPSTVGPPYTVESHLADALAVLDAVGVEKAWAVGHSWGGHLALHLAVAHPDRLHGVVAIGTLGASTNVLPEFEQALLAKLGEDERARVAELESQLEGSEATGETMLEQLRLLWPAYFFDPSSAPPFAVEAAGLDCHRDTFASIKEHEAAGTLRIGLPQLRLPVFFVHGVDDPLPLRGATETARLIRGAKVGRVARCGHFPWVEQPGFVDRTIRALVSEL